MNCCRSDCDLDRLYIVSRLLLNFLDILISGVIHGFFGLSVHRIDFEGACLSNKLVNVVVNCSVNSESVSAGEFIKSESRISSLN